MIKYDYEKLTPMMKQYLDTKKEYPDSILMFRMGDFYEMFFDDAEIASKELDIVLTGRDAGINEKIPMCGVPYHAADNYINRLINKRYKVAICEQLEDPKKSKGLVKRGVTRVITPGTNLQFSEDDSSSNFLASIFIQGKETCLSYVDFSTGNLYFSFVEENINDSNSNLANQISVLEIKEIILNEDNKILDEIIKRKNILKNNYEYNDLKFNEFDQFLNDINTSNNIKSIIFDKEIVYKSLVQLYSYLIVTQFGFVNHIRNIENIDLDEYMLLDKHTLYSLDIFSESNKKSEGTLLHLLDKSKTSMGSRKLRYFLEHPLKKEKQIIIRLNIVEKFRDNLIDLENTRSILNGIYDIERIMVKMSGNNNSPKDLIQLKKSFENLSDLKHIILKNDIIISNIQVLDSMKDIYDLIDNAIIEDPPLSPKEGSIIKEGFSDELDNIKSSSINGKKWILDYESDLKKDTGISKLRIKYNKILGYFIEVSNSHTDKVPDYFIRKQTLVGSERYFTEKLKNTEMSILSSKSNIDNLEFEIYENIRNSILEQFDNIFLCAKIISEIDVYSTFAFVSYNNNYIKPSISIDGRLSINGGRHPIVEKNTDVFIDNDTIIENDSNFILLTGPNMAGKSTYMRQVALISLMMQIGCYVPCTEANLPIFDRIFTRIGAHDNLYMGESTFMVEMKEMSDIIKNATSNSLIILDEVGRGTSTYDGLALAKALIEYIIENINAKTIFATHFHELTTLQNKYNQIRNYTVQIIEKNGELSFLRKVIPGNSDKSYGIHVATLAGINESIIRKASSYLKEYENKALTLNSNQIGFLAEDYIEENYSEVSDETYTKLSDKILDIDINNMTPIESMLAIRDLKNYVKELDEKKN